MKEEETADDSTGAESGEPRHRGDENESETSRADPIEAERPEIRYNPSEVGVKHQSPPPRTPTPYSCTLYSTLYAQHPRRLTSVRAAEQAVAQLHRYFEDVVLENNLSALVVEGLPSEPGRSLRDVARVREVGLAARYSFLFVSPDDG